MKKIKRFFSGDNRISLCIALFLILSNVIIVFCFDLQHFSFEERKLTALQIILSASLYLLYIAFCIFMWVKRYKKLAKGLFYYQLVGAVAYILYFFNFIFRTSFQALPYTIFHAWTLAFDPIMVALGRISGIKAKYLAALCYLILTLITGKTVIAIRKDIAYEKKYKEDHTHPQSEA